MKNFISTFFLIGVISLGYTQNRNTNSIFVKTGVSSNSIQDDGLKQNTFSPLIGIGATIGDKFSFQPELLFSFYKLNVSNYYYSSSYIESYVYDGSVIRISLPLLAKYKIVEKINILVGITPSLILIDKDKGIRNSSVVGTEQPEENFDRNSSINGAITLGAAYNINEKIFIEARYNFTPDFFVPVDETLIYSSSEFNLHEKSSMLLTIGYKLF